ncbi:hypothetical protein XENOCAPTIV_004316 [Xenoophorus captivus]|uniref:Uncharacterized protein n=1 Tax=Xenoophorus captivus TaxID=1517983 RepID=A0ABV0QGD6_9TELE
MQSGSIRVYPLQPGDHSLTSMQAYWALNVHDNQYGHLRHVRCSLDDLFVLTAGDDGNIFCFCLLPPGELQKTLGTKTKIPSPRELLLDRRFYEQAEKLKALKVMEVRKQMAWEQERCSIALRKLQEWSEGSLQADIITVVAIRSDHRVSTYRLPAFRWASPPNKPQIINHHNGDGESGQERRKPRADSSKDSQQTEEEVVLQPAVVPKARVKLGDRQEEKLRKAAEKAGQARAKIERRKQEWAQIYAEKPEEDYMDPEDVQAISEAKENLSEFIKGKQLRVNAELKKKHLATLEEKLKLEEYNELLELKRSNIAKLQERESSLQLRERRLDLEELLAEEKSIAKSLKKEIDMLIKKVSPVCLQLCCVSVNLCRVSLTSRCLCGILVLCIFRTNCSSNSSWRQRTSSRKICSVRLNCSGTGWSVKRSTRSPGSKVKSVPPGAALLPKPLMMWDDNRSILYVSGWHHSDCCVDAELELECNELQMKKFGRLVDLEALQMLTGSRRLEELKQEKQLLEAAQAKEIRHWDVRSLSMKCLF